MVQKEGARMSPTQVTRRRRYRPTPRHAQASSPHHATPHEDLVSDFLFSSKTKIGPWITKMLTKLSVMSRGSVMGHYENVWSTVQAKCPNRMKMMVD